MSRVPDVPPRVFTARVPLRWGDLDSLGHVNNVIFLRLLEEARVQLFAELLPLPEHGVGVLAARHEIDYLKPLHYSTQPVTIAMWVERIGTSSCTVAYVVTDPAGDPVCAARTVIVAIDPNGAATPIPQHLRELLEAYVQ